MTITRVRLNIMMEFIIIYRQSALMKYKKGKKHLNELLTRLNPNVVLDLRFDKKHFNTVIELVNIS